MFVLRNNLCYKIAPGEYIYIYVYECIFVCFHVCVYTFVIIIYGYVYRCICSVHVLFVYLNVCGCICILCVCMSVCILYLSALKACNTVVLNVLCYYMLFWELGEHAIITLECKIQVTGSCKACWWIQVCQITTQSNLLVNRSW